MRFVPASIYLESIPVAQRMDLKHTLLFARDDVNGNCFIILANTIDWLLKHGLTLGRGIALAQKYNAAIGKSSATPISGTDLSELMFTFGGMGFLTKLAIYCHPSSAATPEWKDDPHNSKRDESVSC